MKLLKDIILVTYIKNKGIRRICFVVGILLAILPTYIWYVGLGRNFYSETYKNIGEFIEKNKYNVQKQEEVFNKYPINIKMGSYNFSDFFEWQAFWTHTKMYTNENDEKYITFTVCSITHPHFFRKNFEEAIRDLRKMFPQYNDLSNEILVKNLNHKYGEKCLQFGQYCDQEINISKANFLYLLKLLWSFFWFYLPFLLSCIIKWIYTGFKEK